MSTPPNPNGRPVITVVGLGPMGASLATALLRAGADVTVWNRTPARAAVLVGSGAHHDPDLGKAVAAADLVLLCLRDHDAARQVLTAAAAHVKPGADVVNLSSATPQQARETSELARRRQVSYLSGAIMATTALVGSPEGLILYSGPVEIFERHHGALRALAGQAVHLGDDPGRAAAFDMAMLDMFFAGMTSFLHAAALVERDGVHASTFLPYAESILDVLRGSLADLARDVDAGRYPGTEDTLAMEQDFLAHIVETSAQAGVDPALPALSLDYVRRSVAAGHGQDGFARVIEHLTPVLRTGRRPAPSAQR